ncbi:MAG: anthranilate synthase component I [Wenzhouxiangellaceae bacterium]
MEQSRFNALAKQGYNRIPVFRSVLADLDTPLSVYLKLADGADSYLLESVEGGENWGRYSIIGLPCRRRIEIKRGVWRERDYGRLVAELKVSDPLAAVAQYQQRFKVPELDELPKFTGGLVGYFGYETVAYIEPRLKLHDKPDQLGVPDIQLLVSEEVAVLDNLAGKLYLIVNVDPTPDDAWHAAQRRLDQLEHRLRCGTPGYLPQLSGAPAKTEYEYGFDQPRFEAAVRRIKEYINAGDCMQVVLSQRMRAPLEGSPLNVYRVLRSINPSPYMYYFDLGETQIVGSSPEVLVRVADGEALVRPIAGTRPRGATPAADALMEQELLADPKELAEHLMLIDLGRNDLGRIAATGSVKLTDKMVIERYSHVMHIVSEVHGRLRAGLGPVDALRATFPAGTLSGAQKVRAMEIIAELEPVQRNIYAGAVGYLNWWRDADLAIAIRTAVIRNGVLNLQAGAGIVADSDPTREWEETMNKCGALMHAVQRAGRL